MVDWMAIAGTALQFGLNGIIYASSSEVTKQLWDKLWSRLGNRDETRDALRAVERDRSEVALARLQPALAEAMEADPTFASEVQALVERLKSELPAGGVQMSQKNYDNATGYQFGQVFGNVNIGKDSGGDRPG